MYRWWSCVRCGHSAYWPAGSGYACQYPWQNTSAASLAYLYVNASQACTLLLPCCPTGSVEGRSLQALALAASFRLAPAPWDARRSTAVYRGSCYSTANSSDASPKVQAWAARAQLARYGLPRAGWCTVQGWSGVGHGRQDPAGMLLLCIDWGRRSYCPCGALRTVQWPTYFPVCWCWPSERLMSWALRPSAQTHITCHNLHLCTCATQLICHNAPCPVPVLHPALTGCAACTTSATLHPPPTRLMAHRQRSRQHYQHHLHHPRTWRQPRMPLYQSGRAVHRRGRSGPCCGQLSRQGRAGLQVRVCQPATAAAAAAAPASVPAVPSPVRVECSPWQQ